MLIKDFDYDLPPELIAQEPLARRDQSRMMVLDRTRGTIEHTEFTAFPAFFGKGDVLVLNTSRVIPAKVWGKRGKAEIEFLFLVELDGGKWDVLCRPARKVRIGDPVIFSKHLLGKVTAVGEEGRRILEFPETDVLQELSAIGFAPLPPYIKREKSDHTRRGSDLERYQTVFAETGSSIAAPTAGLHLTQESLEELRDRGLEIVRISLDVGLATFQPVRVEKVEDHRMLEETYTISSEVAERLNSAQDEGRTITAVGTTSVRTLESSFSKTGIRSGKRRTDLFITPGCKFNVVDRLLTNFHLPRSTLLMLVSAFAGTEFIREAYRQAVDRRYRFFSYGDCMLII